MTIEERRQVRVSKIWLKRHPEFCKNMENSKAMWAVIILNDLEWTVPTLEVAYQILKLQKHKFSKEKK
jgi:hypothetical protein